MNFIYVNNIPVNLDLHPDISEMGVLEGMEAIFVRGLVGPPITSEEFWRLLVKERPEIKLVDASAEGEAGQTYLRKIHQLEYKITLKNKRKLDTAEDTEMLKALWKDYNMWQKLVKLD